MGVGEGDVGRVCTEDNVAELDATRGNDVTEGEIVLAEEFREVVEEDEEETESAPVQVTPSGLEVGSFEEGSKELDQRQQELVKGGPSLSESQTLIAATVCEVFTSRLSDRSNFGMKRR